MEFRPCIDIHNGKVKQIVGGSLRDQGDQAKENFVSGQDASFYAELYKERALANGHIILLNPPSSEYYPETLRQAKAALAAWPGGLQIGGGIHADNAAEFLGAGASHVIVTSYVFKDGKISRENLERLEASVGREHLVLDLSCRKRDGKYYIVTDRWQKFTEVEVTVESLLDFSGHCDEFLIHAADVEGKANGVERELVTILRKASDAIGERSGRTAFPITYAGGVGSYEDLKWLKEEGGDRIHVTIGSALDLFGGQMNFEEALRICRL
uniref:phosphoribosylformimino-5-aminoimidazole carboxamide ribotide isomerase n=1 Tax=Eubacterium cellulosolvens TaxID=29322 RepID=UPI0004841162|nr:phosphoribosylformimino-5-aminoimidazole carboxamide ribotide isomerase [[Eubacterium] cellulosolvens]